MENGISLYPGLDNTLAENIALLKDAHDAGIKRIFTSLHIPETDKAKLKQDLTVLLKLARQYDMEVISDVSPATLSLLDIKTFNPSLFRMLGITTLRLDDGFSLDDIAALSQKKQHLRIQLNASTITSSMLKKLTAKGTDFSQIDALHNFYPRRGTGISEEFLIRKTAMLHKFGIKTSAFVPSFAGKKRSPLYDGLPTLEDHRNESTDNAARHLVSLGIDSVFIADSRPTAAEIKAVGSLQERVVLRAKLLTSDPLTKKILNQVFSARADEARDAIRASESRQLLKNFTGCIEPENTSLRPAGAVTIDNKNYQRYMGELQLIKNPQTADARTNVVAIIDENEIKMLSYITPGRKFSLLLHE